jgi:hypothetical protein
MKSQILIPAVLQLKRRLDTKLLFAVQIIGEHGIKSDITGQPR